MLRGPEPRSDLRLELSVLGLPVLLETNAMEVLELARASYDGPSTPGGPVCAPLRVRILADPGLECHDALTPVARLPEPDRLELRLGGGHARAEAARGEAVAYVAPATITAPGFREAVLDHLTLFLATRSDRCPVHAGAIARGGRALLLAGPSGLGKSSLTYAAMKAGFKVLADDAIYVQRDPRLRLWSLPRRIHLPATATRHFPELENSRETVRPDGRWKIPVDIPPGARAPVPWLGSVGLCVLSSAPMDGPAEELSPEDAVVEMRATSQGGFRRFDDVLDDCVREVAGDGCWRLPVTVEPALLVGSLDALFRALGPRRDP